MRLRYDDPPQNTLEFVGEQGTEPIIVQGGQEFETNDDQAEKLLADPSINVVAMDDPETPEATPHAGLEEQRRTQELSTLGKSDLEDKAVELDIDPDDHNDKASLVDAIIKAEAEHGQGHDSEGGK